MGVYETKSLEMAPLQYEVQRLLCSILGRSDFTLVLTLNTTTMNDYVNITPFTPYKADEMAPKYAEVYVLTYLTVQTKMFEDIQENRWETIRIYDP